jgi:hypothetical protein
MKLGTLPWLPVPRAVVAGAIVWAAACPLTRADSPSSTDQASPATDPTAENAAQAPVKGEKGAKKAFPGKANHMEGLLQAIRALPPEKRHQLKENVNAWQKLSESQKDQLRERENVLRKKVAEELASCVSGVRLSAEEMESLQKRYLEERRKMEGKLRAEMELRRKSEIEQLTERFREEIRQKNNSGGPH